MFAQVQEWNDRVTEGDGVIVKLSKGSIRLNRKEEHWPDYLKAQPPEGDDGDRFFLGASGLPLRNPTADVQRLREKYVTRLQEAPTPPAEPQAGMVVSPPRSAAEEEPPQTLDRTSPLTPAVPLPTPRFWGAFEDLFPVTLHGTPPTKLQRQDLRTAAITTTGGGFSTSCVYSILLSSPLTGLAKNPQRLVSSVPWPRRPRGPAMCRLWTVFCWRGCPARDRPLSQMTLSSLLLWSIRNGKVWPLSTSRGKAKESLPP